MVDGLVLCMEKGGWYPTNIWLRVEERRTNKHGLGLALSVRREKFCHFSGILWVYPNEIPTQLPRTLTHPLALVDLVSGSTSSNSSLQQPPISDRCLSLTVAISYLLTALGPCPSSSSSGLVGNLARKPFEVSFAPKQTEDPSDWRSPTPIPTERMPTIVPQFIAGKFYSMVNSSYDKYITGKGWIYHMINLPAMNLPRNYFTNNKIIHDEFTAWWIYWRWIYHAMNLPTLNLPLVEFSNAEFSIRWFYHMVNLPTLSLLHDESPTTPLTYRW